MCEILTEDCGTHAKDAGAVQSRSYGLVDERQEERGQVRVKLTCMLYILCNPVIVSVV